MLQPRLSSAVHFVFCLVLRAQTPVTMPFAVWDACTGALVTAVSNDWGLAAGVVDTGLGERPAVVCGCRAAVPRPPPPADPLLPPANGYPPRQSAARRGLWCRPGTPAAWTSPGGMLMSAAPRGVHAHHTLEAGEQLLRITASPHAHMLKLR
jgi:hypothetical protein